MALYPVIGLAPSASIMTAPKSSARMSAAGKANQLSRNRLRSCQALASTPEIELTAALSLDLSWDRPNSGGGHFLAPLLKSKEGAFGGLRPKVPFYGNIPAR